ncbi:hypothetical protein JGS22_003895 [Streptomyces sp. P38-E01]|uniref:Integral membrane protein n=1 Tax=Streptomyces tardus TaxID=2780544 RepID=A0A949JBL1_9ACTN|nr:hypothetical protein [Streptomyces tardus]MBU7596801.1 hypothetical protein [Streptomyces tardus]
MTDRRRAQGQAAQEDNPWAPPPTDRPDQPWQPRQQGHGGNGEGRDESGRDGSGQDSSGQDTSGRDPWGRGPSGRGGDEQREDSGRTKWGSQWSSRQPGRGNGVFGSSRGSGDDGGRGDRNGSRLRWDPRDPAQRHARYALISSMWSVFFALFNIPPVALLLGALALYWGISSLRGAPGAQSRKNAEGGAGDARGDTRFGHGDRNPAGPHGGAGRRPQLATAIVGIVVGSIGLLFVMSAFTVQVVYKDYYVCVDNALTTPTRQACDEHLPTQLRSILGEAD